MISKLLPRRRISARQATAAVPPGERVYAIGDIHGCCDLLERLIAQIEADDAGRTAARTTLIFLGDLVDRGPESAQVVERLRQLALARPEGSTRFLLGNHEEVFLAALAGDIKAMKFFNRIGGRETILSYGVSRAEYDNADYAELLAAVQRSVPEAHVAFLRGFEDLIIVGDYAFVHAGVRPEAPLANQRAGDLRWIRDEFLGFRGTFEKVIVHGHTISDEVESGPNRIGLDTGAYASGKLSAMGFEGDRRWILQT